MDRTPLFQMFAWRKCLCVDINQTGCSLMYSVVLLWICNFTSENWQKCTISLLSERGTVNVEIKCRNQRWMYVLHFTRSIFREEDVLDVMNEVYYFWWSMEEHSHGVMHDIFSDDISVLDKSLVVAILKMIWSASFYWYIFYIVICITLFYLNNKIIP